MNWNYGFVLTTDLCLNSINYIISKIENMFFDLSMYPYFVKLKLITSGSKGLKIKRKS